MENSTDSVKRPPVLLYTEQTPNPETLKFVTNTMLYAKRTADFKEDQKELALEWSPLATALFGLPYVKGVYICNNFVTITKEFNFDWSDIMLDLKDFIKKYVQEGNEIVKEGFDEIKTQLSVEETQQYSGEQAEIVVKIKQMIETYVKPAVEMDGGNIEFKSFEQGVVTLIMQGSCSGCPSSGVTLKNGIEGMLKRMVPEVKEVVAYAG
jgi:Fe-S cluster biogenesis protein NfuA